MVDGATLVCVWWSVEVVSPGWAKTTSEEAVVTLVSDD